MGGRSFNGLTGMIQKIDFLGTGYWVLGTALLIPVHRHLPLLHPFLQVAFHTHLDRLSRGGEDEGKTRKISKEARGDEKSAAHQEHGPVDQVIAWHSALLHFQLDVADNPEPLFPGVVGAQNTRENDDENGVKGTDH